MGITLLLRLTLAALVVGCVHPSLASASDTAATPRLLDVPSLLQNRADTGSSPLLAGMQAPRLEPRTTFEGYRVSSSMLIDQHNQPAGFIVLVNREDGGFTALVNTSGRRGVLIGRADGSQVWRNQRVAKEDVEDFLPDPRQNTGDRRPRSENETAADDKDYVLTVLAGFSDAAAREVEDPKSFALAQIETLNLALKNTGITNIRVALSGISTTPIDYVINSENLKLVEELFPNHPKADVIASFVASPIENGVIGLAYRYGTVSMTNIDTTTTFAHEIGHNIGGGHCNLGESDFAYGYWTGKYGSILCSHGTETLSFSNPELKAPDGAALGDPASADMARTWRTEIQRKASGLGNDAEKPVALYSLDAIGQCVDVLDGNFAPGAKVGLRRCDQNNPDQRWNKLYVNDRIQLWLAASPSLCLYNAPASGSRPVVLTRDSCQYILWSEENLGLKIHGNGEYLYLSRGPDNELSVSPHSSSESSHYQNWSFDHPYRQLVNKDNGYCIAVAGTDYAVGSPLILAECKDDEPAQGWVWTPPGRIHSIVRQDLCIGNLSTPTLVKCQQPPALESRVLWGRANGEWIATPGLATDCLFAPPNSQPGSAVEHARCSAVIQKEWLIPPVRLSR